MHPFGPESLPHPALTNLFRILVVGRNSHSLSFKKVLFSTLSSIYVARFPHADVALRPQREVDVAGAEQEAGLESVVRLRRRRRRRR